jgi:hypothetical protein
MDQAVVEEAGEVVADRGLGLVDEIAEGVDVQFAVLDQRQEDLESRLVGQDLEDLDEVLQGRFADLQGCDLRGFRGSGSIGSVGNIDSHRRALRGRTGRSSPAPLPGKITPRGVEVTGRTGSSGRNATKRQMVNEERGCVQRNLNGADGGAKGWTDRAIWNGCTQTELIITDASTLARG